jgi:putative hydrolase of the HAD superfamily
MIKGLLFDYGGTLDTNGRHWAEVLWAAYVAESVSVTKEQFRQAYVFGERTLAQRPLVLPHHHFGDVLHIKCGLQAGFLLERGEISQKEADRITIGVSARCYNEAKQCTNSARQTLELLSPIYPMALVSNFYGNIAAVLDDFGLAGFFPHIVESSVVGIRKPDPQIFRLGAEALGLLPEECVVIGDSESKDILPSQSIGCQTIWLKGEAWVTTGTESQTAGNCLAVISDFKELIKYLG